MSLVYKNFRASMLAGAASLCLAPQAFAAGFSVALGATDNAAKTVHSGDTGSIGAGGLLSASTPITWSLSTAGATAAIINNSGTINASGSSRGIDTSGSAAGAQSFTFNNLTSSSILTSTSDAFRVNGDIGAGTVTVDNFGSIKSSSSSGGRALSFNAGITSSAAHVNITNETGGLISAAGDDAIRPGTGHVTIANSGTIQSTATGSTVGRAINLNTTNLNSLQTFSLTNNATGIIQSPGDALRITAGTLQANSTYNVSVDNFGSIKSTGTGANNGQAIDFNDLVALTGSVTITNESSGIIQSADADAVRAGNNSIINNYGQIASQNGTVSSTGNDAIDFQSTNAGTVNNFQGGSIAGARHGITGGQSQTVVNSGAITGQAGSGINIDSVSGTTVVTNNATGVITGNVPASGTDADGIDVDYLVNINNSGKILAVGTESGGEINEALAIGGGTVTNNAGGLIQSDQRAITVDDSNLGNAFGAISIDNAGTITGKDGEAIKITSAVSNTLTNRAGGVINGSVAMGGSGNTINLYTGSSINGALSGSGNNDTIHLLAGTGGGTLSNVSNVANLKVDGGSWALSGGQTYTSGVTVAAGAIAAVSGALGGDVTNNGTVTVNGTTATFTGTFQNNGAFISDPASQTFDNLSIGQDGYIQAAAGDLYKVGGDFDNISTQNTLWDTASATLEFIGADGTSHVLQVAGSDFGAHSGVTNDFGWGELEIDGGNLIQLTDGPGSGSDALYVTELLGALISGNTVTNISGIDGLTIYYDGHAADNAYLGGLSYLLSGGGRLISDVPEPQTWTLLIAGFGLLGAMLRRRRTVEGIGA